MLVMPSNTSEFLLHVARWVGLAAMLLAAGVLMFRRIVWGREQRPRVVEERFATRSQWLLVAALVASVAAVLIALFLEAGYAQLDAVRLGLVAIPAGLALAAAKRSSDPTRATLLLEAFAVIGFVLGATLAGHVRGSSPLAPNLAAATVHVAAAAAWAGGLVALIVAALPASRTADPQEGTAIMAQVVARFSNLALACVVAVVVSGTYSSWVEVRTLDELTGSTYGVVLLAKIGALIPILVIGAVNNRWTRRRLLRAASSREPATNGISALRRLVAWEVAFLVGLVGLTALLLSLSPPVRQL
jgi:copper transport protein